MKPKSLMLSAAVLLGSAAVAFAQTQTPAPSSQPATTQPAITQPATTQPSQQPAADSMSGGTGSSAAQSNTAQPASTGMSQAQTRPPRTSKHRAMVARRGEERMKSQDRATTALNVLEANGYRDFSTFHPMGRNFAITANQNGKKVTVVVDPATKSVRPEG